jgi:oligopeptide/dipeptide ABC transporter ATP-binding protein
MSATDTRTPLIEVVDLRKHFRLRGGAKLHAVDGINLRIYPQETVGVVGESGCGKSTLGRSIIRLIEPTSGQILYNGANIMKVRGGKLRELRKDLQIIFQDPYSSLDPRKSIIEIIAEYMFIHRQYRTTAETYNQAAKLMDLVGLARRYANSYPHELDGGRRQRVGIARALSLNPKFIICDEPVSALDVSIQAQILNLLMDLEQELGLTYMFITHDMSVVKHISNRIMVMYLGKCVEMASSDELFANPQHPYTKALLSAIPVPDLATRDQEFVTIRGEVSNPINVKPGCRFAKRCDLCTEACTQADPEPVEVAPDHQVSCVLMRKGA